MPPPRGRLFHAPRLRRALQTGEVVRIHRERGRNFVCKIIDVLPLAELDDEQRSAWLREKTASQCVVMVQWFGIVGDETKLYPTPRWSAGEYHRCKGLPEVVLRDERSLIGDLMIEGVVTVWPGHDVQSRAVDVRGMADVFIVMHEEKGRALKMITPQHQP